MSCWRILFLPAFHFTSSIHSFVLFFFSYLHSNSSILTHMLVRKSLFSSERTLRSNLSLPSTLFYPSLTLFCMQDSVFSFSSPNLLTFPSLFKYIITVSFFLIQVYIFSCSMMLSHLALYTCTLFFDEIESHYFLVHFYFLLFTLPISWITLAHFLYLDASHFSPSLQP